MATLAGSGSIPFSLDRDNARGFGNLPFEEVTEFLSKNRRTVVILPPNVSLDYLRGMMPSNAEIVDVINDRIAKFVLVHHAKGSDAFICPNRLPAQAALQ